MTESAAAAPALPDHLLEAVAAPTPSPGGGSVAAIVVAFAASLVEKAARLSGEDWPHAGGAVAQAEALRARVAPLAEADALAYAEAVAALRTPGTTLGPALSRAAEIPLLIAEAAVDVAILAQLAAEEGDPEVRGDVVTAAILAEAGARVAAHLVEINLGALPEDERVVAARGLALSAVRAAEAALAVESC
jgi:formiminotetrahydrofolate cyclodeaminase